MHWGVFHGKLANNRKDRILILGESHHVSTEKDVTTNKGPGKRATYSTHDIVEEYLQNYNNCIGKGRKESFRFFDKITRTFGIDPETSRSEFWDQVYFGNYIDVLCGIGDNFAKNQIKSEENRQKYNDQLFAFVNAHNISQIFCFSILSYKNLPSLVSGEEENSMEIGQQGKRNVYLYHCQCKAGVARNNTSIVLEKDLEVFGIRHPSAKGGYPLDLFAKALSGKI